MKIKVSDFIADYLTEQGIKNIFSVVGGGSIHMNDAFGHKDGLTVTYHHHEQAAAIAAEAYARLSGKMAVVCVTSGPGATNALTGCLCAYMGSVPMLIFSGQVRYPLTVAGLGLNLRSNGEQEYEICRSAAGMTKYCEMVKEPNKVLYCIEKAIHLANSGRPGPCWLDMPLDIQASIIETDELLHYNPEIEDDYIVPKVSSDTADEILDRISRAERPIIYIGQGVRQSGGYEKFLELADILNVPITTGMTSLDNIPNDHPLYAGRTGATGDRAGNFAVQNSDLFLSIGSRLSYKQTGYDTKTWARAAYKIMVDIDSEELKRDYLGIDMPLFADAKDFIETLLTRAKLRGKKISEKTDWINQCREWVVKYPTVTEKNRENAQGRGNIYYFYKVLSELMPENAIYVTTSGNSRVVGRQVIKIKKGQRVIVNHSTSPMGYCLPASIGTCIASGKKEIVLIAGEGGFQMNIQELQTIKQNKLPIKIIVINNGGYHSIRITQNAFFKNRSHVSVGEESGDLSFPDISKIAYAYGYDYFESKNNDDVEETLKALLAHKGNAICQVFVSTTQFTEPKASSKRLPNGQMASAPLEDMAPFLPREELEANMYIE